MFSSILLLFLFPSECAQNLKPPHSDLFLLAVAFKLALALCFGSVSMKQLANILTLSISLPGRASHIKERDFCSGWAGRIERPALKGGIMLADITFKSISPPGKRNKKGMPPHSCFCSEANKETYHKM